MLDKVTPSWIIGWGNLNQQAVTDAFLVQDEIAISGASTNESPSQRFVVVGDIWLSNRLSLFERLGMARETHQTNCELIALLWEKWGVDCLTELQGMFAIAVYDRAEKTLFLARDPVGGYTLYYTISGTTKWIAPRLKSLLSYHTQQLDLVALRDYLSCSFVPGERTMWRDVRELRPGMILQFPQQQKWYYWQPQEHIIGQDQNQSWHANKLRSRLDTIVQEYLPENEPVGVYLSGGLDSSCITALVSQYHDQPVHTYAIHFGKEFRNELAFSRLVAEHCQTHHHILEISLKQMWQQLPTAMSHLDDPIGDPLTVPNFLLAQQAKNDVGIIFNGEGGDPCFGGPKNQPMLLNQLYSNNQQQIENAYLLSFKKCAEDLPQLLRPEIWHQVKNEPTVFADDLFSSAQYLNRLMGINIKFKGADHILTKVNNITRSANLEARSPLFDQRIVQLSMEIPPEYKLAGAEEKAVLKQAVQDLLPETIIKRPKSGMMVPVQIGFSRYWQRKAKKLLLSKHSAIAPYLNQDIIKDFLNFRGDVWRRFGVKLWLLTSLEMWLRMNR